MSTELPLVSLCTPTFNRRRYIPLAIRCIELQTYPKDKMEWIIVNDGDEEIEDILNDAIKTKDLPKIKYYRYKTRMILGEKRNLCNKYASGDIIVNMDDDDYYPPQRVSLAVNTLLENPKVYCAGISKLYTYFKNYDIFGVIGPSSNNHLFTGSFAFKKELLKITSYDNKCESAEEHDFLLKLNLPVIQLDPLQTIIALSHETNTSDRSRFAENIKTYILEEKTPKDFIPDDITRDLFIQ